jgi:hypothetical protein
VYMVRTASLGGQDTTEQRAKDWLDTGHQPRDCE